MSSTPDPTSPQQQSSNHWSPQHQGPPPGYDQNRGGYPSDAPPQGDPALRGPDRPRSVRVAVGLMWGGVGLSLVGLVSTFALLGQTRAMVEQELAGQGLEMSPELVDTTFTIGIVVGVVSGLVGAALWALNAVFCRRGAQWSRILGTVLGGVYLLNSIYSFLQPAPTLSMVLLVLTLLLVVATIITLWLPASNTWFRAVTAPRPPGAPPQQHA